MQNGAILKLPGLNDVAIFDVPFRCVIFKIINYWETPMKNTFKPENYNSLSPYFIVDNCKKMKELLNGIFDARELRKYENDDGSIMHMELQIDDSVICLPIQARHIPPTNC